MNPGTYAAIVLCLLSFIPSGRADLLKALGLRKTATSVLQVSEDKALAGLKEALAQGVENAVTNLGRVDGFLADAAVRVPLPQNLQWADKAVRAVGQGRLVDDFVVAMNRAAEAAVPKAAGVLGDAVRQMTVADARQIISATNSAATAYFERTSRTNLHASLLPIIKNATDQAGVTAYYKGLLDKAGLGSLSGFGVLSRSFLGGQDLDLDDYVTRKSLDGLFQKIAEEEQRIRSDPAARTTALLQQVFGRLQ